MGKNYSRAGRSGDFRWPTTTGEIIRYLGIAVLVGVGAAFALNAYEAHQAREAILDALPPGYQFPGCDIVRARGLDPLYSYEPGYSESMDGDGDGIACEPYP
ncbi:excalibur calcium-binding domain-containing protein [Novosphingobium sp. BL-52-GroH]|uniref:excalibur calcium-binding domain-containing protein n=1 Tax=Novosphingobium sp. BL-52-GroH TaxID=3349877 RepID=UPI00384EB45B